MVRALLAGTKTQTRRIVKPQPHGVALVASGNHLFDYRDDLGDYSRVVPMDKAVTLCPQGKPGDRLWVREAWAGSVATVVASADPGDIGSQRGMVAYRATYASNGCPFDKWRPSIHMPRWASRITLEITGVRVQRLQEISDEDALAEGIDRFDVLTDGNPPPGWHRGTYSKLWERVNGPGSWDENPWVWAISFRRFAP